MFEPLKNPVQLLLPLFVEDQHRILKVREIEEKLKLGQERRKSTRNRMRASAMGTVGKKLCWNYDQLLLHAGEDYWLAQPKVDATLVRKRFWSLVKRKITADTRLWHELKIYTKRHLVPEKDIRSMELALIQAAGKAGTG
jgi:hypothetical protein